MYFYIFRYNNAAVFPRLKTLIMSRKIWRMLHHIFSRQQSMLQNHIVILDYRACTLQIVGVGLRSPCFRGLSLILRVLLCQGLYLEILIQGGM